MEFIKKNKQIILILCMIAIALISFFIVSDSVTLKNFIAKCVASLEEKKGMVIKTTAASAALSTAVTLIPGDVAMPIAEKLADVSDYTIFVFAAIWLQKFLLPLTTLLVFKILVPIYCLLNILNTKLRNFSLKLITNKILAIGIIVITIIPVSIYISNVISQNYNPNINQVISDTTAQVDQINQDKGILEKITDNISNGVQGIIKSSETQFNNILEVIAIFIVTSFLIPILVFSFFTWIMNVILGYRFNPIKTRPRFVGSSVGTLKMHKNSLKLGNSNGKKNILE